MENLKQYSYCKIACNKGNDLRKHLQKQHKYYLHVNNDLADYTTHKRANHGDQNVHSQEYSESLESSSVENLKQHIDYNLACNRGNDLRKHFKQKHTNYIEVKCEDCNSWNYDEKDLKKHLQVILNLKCKLHEHQVISMENLKQYNDCKFVCKLCERRNYDERNLKKHLQVKHGEVDHKI